LGKKDCTRRWRSEASKERGEEVIRVDGTANGQNCQ